MTLKYHFWFLTMNKINHFVAKNQILDLKIGYILPTE